MMKNGEASSRKVSIEFANQRNAEVVWLVSGVSVAGRAGPLGAYEEDAGYQTDFDKLTLPT